MLADQFLLSGQHGATHQGNYPTATPLMQFHASEEAFHDDHRAEFFGRPVKVEEFQGFFEVLGQLVFGDLAGLFKLKYIT